MYAETQARVGVAMFSTVFLPGRQCAIYFSPAVLAQFPAFTEQVGAQACERPATSVALCLGPVDARDLLLARD
ncbi:MAG: hypothetical protein ABW136_12630 [Steroidobacteraceae bacterium]